MPNHSASKWHPLILVFCNLVAALLLASWFYEPIKAVFWDKLDNALFFALNGSLESGYAWQWFWAVTNARAFDVFSGLIILGVFASFVFADNGKHVAYRTAIGFVMTFFVLLAAQISKTFLDIDRTGPSLIYEDSIRLSRIITSFAFKDSSPTSFPGDHALVVMMVSTFFVVHTGRKLALFMIVFGLFLLTPRLVVGAHWLTDDIVGSGAVALVVLSWLMATPLQTRLLGWLEPVIQILIGISMKLLQFLVGGRDVTNDVRELPKTIAKGFCMGSADIVPGVSGGTMAFILGIYERLLEAIRSFDLKWIRDILRFNIASAIARNDLLFLVSLLTGILFALLFFTKVIPLPALIISHPELVYGLFFGLIIASIIILMQQVGKLNLIDLVILIAGTGLGLIIVNLVPATTPEASWFIFFSGFIAISAMLLPGISGSFILLILGKYAYIINALGDFNFSVILPFVLGCVTGVIAFSRVIVWMLHHYHKQTLLIIKGILIGSLWMIWPWQERTYEIVREKQRLIASTPIMPQTIDTSLLFSISLALIGFMLVMTIHYLSLKKRASGEKRY
ncbi:MAG: DUF368 domain-containing protein [Gammaproteobacteria bacterium]|nr:DUF368 domain-containing protein [Gammaproteobacteria bacterium]MDH5594316.1 DUF368 domain-containing protein [Gammaproteobacteria bacterium]MDH5614477.1 DUF368 domain-containing protein [Gammaproteobacteria bacterium]